ncbi:response regulator [Gillisia sp. M10.2A]|uniref:Response regulator n=1 Tax=Gillisia lutea TaxID=2909668 RepID=A0ABS9EFJ3_9FLAO|nr:response regulator [Gillisia lutea]MCF4101650.1 response regulator [Gillisia lutea]
MAYNLQATENLDVIIVEDDPIVSKIHKFSFGKIVSNDLKTFENGLEAINYLNKEMDSNRKVLVLLDINMPVMDGWEFLELSQVHTYSKNIFVVMVTSSLFQEDFNKAKKYDQIIGYYIKPLKKEQIQELLDLREVRPFIQYKTV